jgi:hypothetical protein
MTASRSGFGIPLRFVLPSAASPNIVSISCGRGKDRPAAARLVVSERDTFYSAVALGARRDHLPEL